MRLVAATGHWQQGGKGLKLGGRTAAQASRKRPDQDSAKSLVAMEKTEVNRHLLRKESE